MDRFFVLNCKWETTSTQEPRNLMALPV